MARPVLFVFGLIAVGLGFIGLFLPIIPTTPFLIVAAACFARSSQTFHRWLLSNKYFGPTLIEWEQHKTMSFKAKTLSLVLMNFSVITALIFVTKIIYIRITLLVLAIVGSLYILHIPTTNTTNRKQKRPG